MRFKDFLREAKHRQDISVEKAEELIRTNCSDMDISKPFWRGSKNASEDAYIITGEDGYRDSANTSNYYTNVMDEFLPAKGFPKRSKSIILSTDRVYAIGYGTPYAIFPFNNVPIGVVNANDIWDLKTTVGEGPAMTLARWNDWFDDAGIPDFSFEDMVQGIKDGIEDDDDTVMRIFKDAEHIEQELKMAYTPPMLDVKLATSKTVPTGDHELWIGGKCVAVQRDAWEKMVKGKA